MFNVVYSIRLHQEVEYINHLLKNIEKNNTKNNYMVIIHLSTDIFKVKEQIYTKNVIINPIHYNIPELYTHLLMKSFVQNVEYLVEKDIKYANIITLSSGMRFVRDIPIIKINNTNICKNEVIQDIEELQGWNWPAFKKNKDIIDIFKKNKIKLMFGVYTGRIYPRNVSIEICKFIRNNNIMNIIQNETVFDEIILPSLGNYYMNKNIHKYSHIFWNKIHYIPSKKDITEILKQRDDICIIKRFPNDINHELYKLLDAGYF